MPKPKTAPQFVPPPPAGLGPIMPGQSAGPVAPMPTQNALAAPPARGMFDEFLPPPPQPSQFAKPGPYVTQLPPADESSFKQWVQQGNVPFDDSPTSDYDMRGYWKDIASKGRSETSISQFDGAPHYPDTYKTPYHKTFSRESKYATPDAPAWQGSKLIGKDGAVIADETPQPGLFDEFLPQQSPAPTGAPAGNPAPAAAIPAKPPKFADVKKKLHGPQTAGKIIEPKPTAQQMEFQKGLAMGKAQGAAAGHQLLNSLEGVPFVGPIVKGAEGNVQQIADTGSALQTKGLPAVMGAIASGMLPGAISVPESIANYSNHIARSLKGPGEALQGKAPVEQYFTGPLQPLMQTINMATKTANKLMGREETKPIRASEETKKIPAAAAKLADVTGASNLPVMKEIVAATKNSYTDPALAAPASIGETAGGLAASLLTPWAIPVKAAGVLGNPLLHGMASGAINAPGYGALTNLGEQAREQQQAGKSQPLDYAKAVDAGLSTIPAGAMLGGVGGAVGAGTKKVLTNLKKGESGGSQSLPGPQTIDVQGNALTVPDALKALDNPQVPVEYKQHILAALDAADNALISGQQAASQTIPAKPVERGPAPASKQPKPEPPGWRMGKQEVTPEQAAFEAGKGPMQPAQQVPMPIGEGLGFDHIKDYNQGEWVGPQEVSTAGPKDPNAINQGMWTGSPEIQPREVSTAGPRDPGAVNQGLWTGSQPESAPVPVAGVPTQPNAAKVTGYANPFTDSNGKAAQMPLAQFKAAAEEAIHRAPDAAAVDQAYNDAEAWASKNVKGALKKPYQQELVRLREERLAQISAPEAGLFDEFLPQETATMTAPSEPTPLPVDAESFAPPPAEAATTPRYLVEKHPDKKGYWNLLDTTTGAVLRSNKDAKQLSVTAEKWNVDGPTDQGKAQIPLSEGIIKEGKPLPVDAPQAVRESFEEIGYLKNEYDKIRAQMEGAAQAIGSMSGGKVPTRLARLHSPAAEAKRRQLLTENPADFGLEVNSEGRLPPDMSFLEGQTKQQLYEHYQTLADRLSQTEEQMRAAKQKLHMPHDSVTFDFDGRKFNIRQVPQRGESVKAFGSEQKWGGKQIADTKAFVKKAIRTSSPAELEQVYSSAANSTSADAPPVAEPSGKNLLQIKAAADKVSNVVADAVSDFVHGEEGSGEVGYGVDLATLGTGRAIASSLVKGAKHGQVRRLIESGRESVDGLLKLRRTLDYVHDYDAQLHNAIWRNIAMETIKGRGVKFDESHQPLLEQSMRMEANAIRMGEEGLDQLTAEQRHYLATRRKVRLESARLLRREMESLKQQHGNPANMPPSTKNQYKAMQDLEAGLTGSRPAQEGGLLNWANGAMYDYLFKWNPAYHALNLTDPLIIGSSRVGINRILAAKAELAPVLGDSKVQQFIADIADVMENPMKPGDAGGGLLGWLPDMPSVQWNNRDMVTAGLLLHADRIKYPGGGGKFLRDLAGGKLSEQQQVEAMVEALQVNNDVNGAGTHGLDRDMVARDPRLQIMLQFTSQPLRQTRLLSKYLREGNFGALGTFFAAQLVLSGSGVIPKDVEQLWQSQDPEGYDQIQKALNQFNLIEHVAGRSITDKLRWAVIPALSGSTSNIAMEKLTDVARAVYKLGAEHGDQGVPGDLVDAVGRAATGQQTTGDEKTVLALLGSIGAGGGGGTASRLWKEIEAGVAGVKEERAYQDQFIDLFQPYAIAKRKIQQYELPQSIGNALLPGKPAETAQWEREERTKKAKKNLLKLKKKES